MAIRYSGLITAILVLGLTAGCFVSGKMGKARTAMEQYYEAVRAQDYKRVLNFYGSVFFENTKKSDWLQTLKKISRRLGDFKSAELQDSSMWKQPDETRVTLFAFKYKTTYEKGEAMEFFTVHLDKTGTPKIMTYEIQSKLIEMKT